MRHSFFDRYSHLDSALHRLDPRSKLLLVLALLILVLASQRGLEFFFWYGLILALILLSRVPLSFFAKRLLLVTPLVLAFAFFYFLSGWLENRAALSALLAMRGRQVAWVAFRTYAAVLFLSLLSSTTRFTDLLWALRRLRLPVLLTTLAKLVYTYSFVLVDEMQRMQVASRSRAPVLRVPRLRHYSQWLGSLFLRSLNRADSLYLAMISRGFTGEFPEGDCHHLHWPDALAGLLFLALVFLVKIVWKA